HTASGIVDSLDRLQVVAHVQLVIAPGASLAALLASEFGREGLFEVVLRKIVGGAHTGLADRAALGGVVVAQGVGLGDGPGRVEMFVSRVRDPIAVRSLVMKQQ